MKKLLMMILMLGGYVNANAADTYLHCIAKAQQSSTTLSGEIDEIYKVSADGGDIRQYNSSQYSWGNIAYDGCCGEYRCGQQETSGTGRIEMTCSATPISYNALQTSKSPSYSVEHSLRIDRRDGTIVIKNSYVKPDEAERYAWKGSCSVVSEPTPPKTRF